jgi:hypothetical protein
MRYARDSYMATAAQKQRRKKTRKGKKWRRDGVFGHEEWRTAIDPPKHSLTHTRTFRRIITATTVEKKDTSSKKKKQGGGQQSDGQRSTGALATNINTNNGNNQHQHNHRT